MTVISCTVTCTAQPICAFVFVCAKSKFSHDSAKSMAGNQYLTSNSQKMAVESHFKNLALVLR